MTADADADIADIDVVAAAVNDKDDDAVTDNEDEDDVDDVRNEQFFLLLLFLLFNGTMPYFLNRSFRIVSPLDASTLVDALVVADRELL